MLAATSGGSAARGAPDAGALAYAVGRSDKAVWVESLELASGTTKALTPRIQPGEKRQEWNFRWSPDGSMLAFARQVRRRFGSGVFVVNRDGTALRRLMKLDRPSTATMSPPTWSPDGAQLAFNRWSHTECRVRRPFALRITIVGLDRQPSEIRALERPTVLSELGGIRWSPNGERLAYIVYRLDNFGEDPNECRWHRPAGELFTISPDGSNRRLLVRGREVWTLTWSPDGRRIAYMDCAEADDGCALWTVDVMSARKKRLVADDLSPCCSSLAWEPSGRRIIVLNQDRITAYDSGSGRPRLLTRWPDPADRDRESGEILGFTHDGSSVVAVPWWELGTRYEVKNLRILVQPLTGRPGWRTQIPSRRTTASLQSLPDYTP